MRPGSGTEIVFRSCSSICVFSCRCRWGHCCFWARDVKPLTNIGYIIGHIAMEIEISFGWWRERNQRDYVIKGDPRKRSISERVHEILRNDIPHIVAKGVALDPYRPLDEFPDLYGRFMDIRSADDAIKFVRTFGPLTLEGMRGKGESIRQIEGQARGMAEGNLHVGFEVCSITAQLFAGYDGLRLRVVPNNLLDALWLQYAQAKAAGLANRCRNPECQRLFATGPDAGRRRGAEFCSVECKTKFHSLKRSRP